MEDQIISEVLHHLLDFAPEQANRVKSALYMVLNHYDVSPKCTDVRVVNDSWRDDLERFCERKKLAGKSDATIERYQYVLTKVLTFVNKPIKDVTEGDLNTFIEVYKHITHVSNCTLEGIRLVISSFFTWNHERGYIPKNPSRGVDPIKVPKTIKKAYSDEELEKIKTACKTIRDKAIVEFLYTTGVRISEMVALNISDVKIDDKSIIVYVRAAVCSRSTEHVKINRKADGYHKGTSASVQDDVCHESLAEGYADRGSESDTRTRETGYDETICPDRQREGQSGSSEVHGGIRSGRIWKARSRVRVRLFCCACDRRMDLSGY